MIMVMVMTTSASVFGSIIDHIIGTGDRAGRTGRFAVSTPCAILTNECDYIINDFETVPKTGIDTSLTADTFFFINFRNIHRSSHLISIFDTSHQKECDFRHAL